MGNIELARDIVICISGIVVSLSVAFATALLYVLYRKVKTILSTLAVTSSTVHHISTTIKEEVVEPAVRFAALIRGLMGGIDLVAKFFQKKEGGSDG